MARPRGAALAVLCACLCCPRVVIHALAAPLPPSAAAAAAPATARVANASALLSALQTQAVTRIVLLNDAGLEEAEFGGQLAASPLQIQRNVTITSAAPLGAPPDALPLLDLRDRAGILQLCAACTFTFVNVNINNENVVGTGGGMSAFRGQAGSRVVRIGGVGVRAACTDTASALKTLNATQRSPLFPEPLGQQRARMVDALTFRGKLYTNMLRIEDVTSDVPLKLLYNSTFAFGMAIQRINATRLCEQIVSNECLARQSAEACIAELVAASRGGGSASTAGSSRPVAVIAAPAAAAGALLLLAGAGAWVLVRRRMRQLPSRQQQPPLPEVSVKPGCDPLLFQGDAGAPGGGDVGQGGVDQSSASFRQTPSSAGSVSQQCAAAGSADYSSSFGTRASSLGPWQLLSSFAPGVPCAPDSTIVLGPLLGAGSFARVFKAKWAGLDVAVKVIQHHRSSAAAVANEVQLSMQLNHPNLVRAFSFFTRELPSDQQQQQGSPTHGSPAPRCSQTAVQQSGLAGGAAAQQAAALPSVGGSSSSSSAGAAQVQQQPELVVVPVVATSSGGSSLWGRHVSDLDPAHGSSSPQQQGGTGSGRALASSSSCSSSGNARTNRHDSDAAASRAASSSGSGAGGSRSTRDAAPAWALIGHLPATFLELDELGSCSDGPPAAAAAAAAGGSAAQAAGGRGSAAAPGTDVLCETWLVVELCNRGTLARQVAEWRPQASELDMLRLLLLLRDVACGLTLLHAKNTVHADLNNHNVLVNTSPVAKCGLVAKIADLGLSRVLQQHATHRTTHTVGMLTHQPPELLRDGRTSPAVDIYSFGMMMYEAFTRQAAFPSLRYGQIYHSVVLLGVRPPVPPDMPEDYALLMERCWAAEPGQRPTVEMVLACLDLMLHDQEEHVQQQQQAAAQPDS